MKDFDFPGAARIAQWMRRWRQPPGAAAPLRASPRTRADEDPPAPMVVPFDHRLMLW
ncbi:hypothetical protein [Pseudoduganella namucuonensis]|uniref:hypothetical protein n=1 Tax=Pseudoduganella namucuonensis TaxID=1035707 RepID=UPI0015A7166E|nr:hypothetical protein [Pseudoduganella namucuonensis]